MAIENKERIKEHNRDYILIIVSYNKKDTIERLLNASDINIFKDIFSREDIKTKGEAFEVIVKRYSFDKDKISFVADTLFDVKEAKDFGIKDIYLVKNQQHFNTIDHDIKIIKPFWI